MAANFGNESTINFISQFTFHRNSRVAAWIAGPYKSTLSLEAGHQTGKTPVSADLVESVLSPQLDDLEPTLTRHG